MKMAQNSKIVQNNKMAQSDKDKARDEERRSAREKSQKIWEKSSEVSKHNYLENKRINHPDVIKSIRQALFSKDNLLLVPVRDIKGTIHSMQYIREDGTKYFTKNGKIKGNFAIIGDTTRTKEGVILAESLATAASLYQSTNIPVVITFNANNTKEVAKELNKANFANHYVIACEATSLNSAKDAAKELNNARIIFPSFDKDDVLQYEKLYPGKSPNNFNDLYLIKGIEAVTHQIIKNTIEKPDELEKEVEKAVEKKEVEEENIIEFNVEPKKIKQEQEQEQEKKSESASEEEKQKKSVINDLSYTIPPSVQKHYFSKSGKFYNEKMELKFIDEGAQLKAKVFDERIVKHMLDIAQAKNWSSIKVGGSNEFKRTVWLEAVQRNIDVEGYKPSKADLALVKHTTQDLNNTIETHTKHNVHEIENSNIDSSEKVQQKQEVTTEKTEMEPNDSQDNKKIVSASDSVSPNKQESIEQVKEGFLLSLRELDKNDQLKIRFLENELLDVVEKLPSEKKDSHLKEFYTNLTEFIEKGDLSFFSLLRQEQREVDVAQEINTSKNFEQMLVL